LGGRQFIAVVEVDGSTPVNTVDEASYCVKCKFFFFFFNFSKETLLFRSQCLFRATCISLQHERILPSFTRAYHSPRFWRKLSFQRITLIGTCFLPSLVDDFPVNCYTRFGGIKILTTTQSTFSLGRHHMALSTVCGPWSATKNYHLEYLTGIKTERAEILSEPSFCVPLYIRDVAISILNFFACNSKKGDRAQWSLVRDSCKQHEKYPRMR